MVERKNGGFFNALETKDIAGAVVGSKTLGNFHSIERKHFTSTNSI